MKIFILPDEEPEIIKLTNTIRPVICATMDSDFSEVLSILEHLSKKK